MTILQQEIIRLRKEGKTYTEIQNILDCSKGTIAYNCSSDQKAKAKKRAKRHSTKKGAIYKKLQGFCYGYGKRRKFQINAKLFDVQEVLNLIGDSPKCYLTGDPIDLNDMNAYSFDHIIPVCKGGKSVIGNMGLTTKDANQAKGGLTKEEFLALCVKVLKHNGYKVEKI